MYEDFALKARKDIVILHSQVVAPKQSLLFRNHVRQTFQLFFIKWHKVKKLSYKEYRMKRLFNNKNPEY